MNVRHLIKLQPRGILRPELRIFFIRPCCPQPGAPGGKPALGKRKSYPAALAGHRIIYAPLDHLNVLGEPAFDYFVSGSE